MLATYSTNKIMVLKQYVSERRRKKEIDINQTNTRTHTQGCVYVCYCVLLPYGVMKYVCMFVCVYRTHRQNGHWSVLYSVHS